MNYDQNMICTLFVLVNNQQKHTLKIVDLTCFYYDHEYIQKQHNQIF